MLCLICYDKVYIPYFRVVCSTCKYMICTDCVNQLNRKICPFCRKEIVLNNRISIFNNLISYSSINLNQQINKRYFKNLMIFFFFFIIIFLAYYIGYQISGENSGGNIIINLLLGFTMIIIGLMLLILFFCLTNLLIEIIHTCINRL